jgi:hypothetical protein
LEAVVDVMGRVRNLVREVDDLRLEARRGVGAELDHLRPIVSRRVLDDALADFPR